MKFSYNWLDSFFKKDLPKPQKLADKLMMRFFEVEEVRKMDDDTLIDIDILPNRASDCFSHFGVAKEIAAIYDLEIIDPENKFDSKEEEVGDLVDVKIDNNLTPRYVLRGIKGLEVGETPDFIKKRLEVCGLQSINNIVDITNYVMLETGQPLHAFDGGKVGELIKVRRAKKGESIMTLDGDEKELDESILVIADKDKPVGIAGIKGGEGPEIDKDTVLIYLEAANFEGKTIRRASKKLKLRTDASSRFSHGLDPELAERASKRAIYLMKKYANGKPLKGVVDEYPDPVEKKTINLSIKKTQSLLGVEVSKNKIESILKKIDFTIKSKDDDTLEVEIPTKRRDVSLEEDLIEEVGRLYGYENIEPAPPKATVTTPETNFQIFWEDKIRDLFKGAGFVENYNYTFIDEQVKDIFGYGDLIEMKNPVSAKYKYLRPELIPHLLNNIKENENGFEDIRIFEIGKIFPDKEQKMIGGAVNKLSFRELKGVIDLLFEDLGIGTPNYKNKEANSWHTGKTAEVFIGKESFGLLGEVNSDLISKNKIESNVFAFQLNMDKIADLATSKTEYKKISKFPTAVKDLSVLVPTDVRYEKVLDVVKSIGGELLINIELFDMYEGEKIPKNTKNLGLRFLFQAEDKTLTKEEINNLLKKIISSLEAKSGWKVRKK